MFRSNSSPGAVLRSAFLTLSLSLLSVGCSLKKIAINQIGDTLASTGTTFASENDPELARDAIPFTLKLVETVLAEAPNHARLRTSAAAYFTQYAYGFIQLEADYIEAEDYEQAEQMRGRARNLFLRARDHGLAQIEIKRPDFRAQLAESPRGAVAAFKKDSVETLYWTAAAWASAITLGKDDPFLIAELPQVEALIDRALELDPGWRDGAIHNFLITYEMSRQDTSGDKETSARAHFKAAVEASQGRFLSPYISLAEAVSVQIQNHREFQSLLNQALAIDINEYPEARLVNLLMKKRALWLLSQLDELFLMEESEILNE
ncbi:MAG: hypothetical protein M2R45_00807 [Verrucomicrobia subdivision 3 bacterium]|nr:hypothetical protein [Limisphaerales bacterium]MCS1413088.1 hypothetical protein [Limisphaerales bacterium]